MPSEQFTSLSQFEPSGGPGIQNDQINGELSNGQQKRAPAVDYREGVFPGESDL